jgi:DnaJ family protein C protein 2
MCAVAGSQQHGGGCRRFAPLARALLAAVPSRRRLPTHKPSPTPSLPTPFPPSLPPAEDSEPSEGGPSDGGDDSEAPLSSRPSSGALNDADMQPPPGVSWKRSKSKRKLSDKGKKKADYYALLGLVNERWTATEAQIKLGEAAGLGKRGRCAPAMSYKSSWLVTAVCGQLSRSHHLHTHPTPLSRPAAYRKTCLEAHPDKKLVGVDCPDEKQKIEDAFKVIQVRRGG